MNRVYIDEECKMCTSYGKWISSKNLNIDLNAQINLTPEEIEAVAKYVSEKSAL